MDTGMATGNQWSGVMPASHWCILPGEGSKMRGNCKIVGSRTWLVAWLVKVMASYTFGEARFKALNLRRSSSGMRL